MCTFCHSNDLYLIYRRICEYTQEGSTIPTPTLIWFKPRPVVFLSTSSTFKTCNEEILGLTASWVERVETRGT